MKRALVNIILLMLLLDATGQGEQFLFKSMSRNNGLSHNQVNCFLRDKSGFLWIGTKEGLSRFDGFSFKNYTYHPSDSASLKNNFISNLFEDPHGKIWLATGNYFTVFDPKNESFSVQNAIFNNQIIVPYGSKWIAKYDHNNDIIYINDLSGIFKISGSQNNVVSIRFPYKQIGKEITSMDIDGQDNIWVACKNGVLYKILRADNKVKDSIRISALAENNLHVFCDNSNNLWVFNKGVNDGLYLIRENTKTPLHITKETAICKLKDNAITDINEDNQGFVWVGTATNGVNIIDKNTLNVTHLTNNLTERKSLSGNNISALYSDYEGIIWVGTYKQGFSYHHKNLFKFSTSTIRNSDNFDGTNDITSAIEDAQENLWLGSNAKGLFYYNRKDNTYKQYNHNPANPSSISSNSIKTLLIDKDNRLWVGTTKGLNLFNGNSFEHFEHDPANPWSIANNIIEDLCQDSEGKIWIATNQGLSLFDPDKKVVIKQFRHTTNADSTIQAHAIFSVIEDRDNILWFATDNGLRSFDRRNIRWEYFNISRKNASSISSYLANDIFEDSRGFIWVATNYGLNKYNKATKDFTLFTKENGLPSNIILSITEDKQHTLWIGTLQGLSNLSIVKEPDTKTYAYSFANYNRFDGLQGNEFNERAVLKTRSGELLFGGPDGFNIFNPIAITSINCSSKIIFTDLKLMGRSITPNTLFNNRKILQNTIAYTSEIVLKSSENVLEISFSSPCFFQPENRKYLYKLENFDKDWIEIARLRSDITYKNLDPGKYILKIKTNTSNGSWNDNSETALIIKVLPPWWGSTIFRLIVFLLLVAVGYWLYSKHFHKLKLQNISLTNKLEEQSFQLNEVSKILDDKQEEITLQHNEIDKYHNNLDEVIETRTRELQQMLRKVIDSDRLKSAFLANMSFEIRTPMNAIVGFASMLKNNDLSEEDKSEFVDIINQNCASLMVLINDIMDISKIESNQITINKAPFAVHAVLEELENYYKLNNIKNIEIKYNRPANNEPVIVQNDLVRFRQVLTNLLSNAYRFTENGYIKFGFEVFHNEIEFYVSDTGIGIKQDNFDKIFDYLQKVKEQDLFFQGGSGLGLPISRKLVELMGGRIWLKSKEGEGSTFFFTIPYQAAQKVPQTTVPDKKPTQNLSKFTILVAEDEPANYFLIDRILKSTHANIIWAKNGKEAVDFISRLPEHNNIIVLMDIKMPVMNGIDALRNIRLINKNIPVIAVTAYAYETEKLEIIQKDFNDYIIKPLKPEKLIEILGKFIS